MAPIERRKVFYEKPDPILVIGHVRRSSFAREWPLIIGKRCFKHVQWTCNIAQSDHWPAILHSFRLEFLLGAALVKRFSMNFERVRFLLKTFYRRF